MLESLVALLANEAVRGILIFALGYGAKYGKDYILGTKTKMDDKILKIATNLIFDTLDEYDFGKTEDVLRKVLKKAKLTDEDTTDIEKVIEDKKEEIKKK